MRIIPAIDIIDGKCVRLTQGDYTSKKIYSESPLDVARQFESAGIQFLHVVDLDGAKAGKVINWEVIAMLASQTSLQIDFGGGIKTDAEIEKLFDLGVRQINLGSIAVKDPAKVSRWIDMHGTEKIIISADIRDRKISISGWMENSGLNIDTFIADYEKKGITHFTCTDISTDGTLAGPNTALYRELLLQFPAIRLVASGGVGQIKDLRGLAEAGVDGVIIGKALYEGRISLEALKEFK